MKGWLYQWQAAQVLAKVACHARSMPAHVPEAVPAGALGLTPATVRTYLRTAYAVLGVRNKLELVAALRNA